MTDRNDSIATEEGWVPVSRRQLLSMLGAGAATAIAGMPAWAQGDAKRGGVLRVSGPANPSSLDPATGGAGSDHAYLWTMYDTLVEWDYETLKPKPGLASWSFPDPRTMVLVIKPGITFHDGTPLDAQAVKFNLDRGRGDARSNIKADLSSIASVEASGPLQVTVKLARPDAALPAILSDRAGMMASPKAVQEFGNEHDRKPVGAGPWKFVSWADNQKIVVTRNEKYWRNDRGFLDGIEFSIIPELSTGLRSVVAGQNDMAYSLPPRLKPIVEKAKNLRLATGPTLYCLQIYLNLAKKPLDNVKVRQAFQYAINREEISETAFHGQATPLLVPYPKTSWAYAPDLADYYTYYPEKAKALLAEAGFLDEGVERCLGRRAVEADQRIARRRHVEQMARVRAVRAEHCLSAARRIAHRIAVGPARAVLAEQREAGLVVTEERVLVVGRELGRVLHLVDRDAVGGVVRIEHGRVAVERPGGCRRDRAHVLDVLIGVARAHRQAEIPPLLDAGDRDERAALARRGQNQILVRFVTVGRG